MNSNDMKRIFEALCKRGTLGPSTPYDKWYLDNDGVLVEVKSSFLTKEIKRHEEYKAKLGQ